MVGAQAPGTEGGAWRLPGGGWRRERRWRRAKRATSWDAALDARLGGIRRRCAPPEAAGLAPQPRRPLPGSGEGRVRRGGGMGARQHPSPPSCRARKLTRRFGSLPPRPHPGKPVRETDSRRDPDIGATRSAGRPARPSTPAAPRRSTCARGRAGTGRGARHQPGAGLPGRPEKPGASSPESYHLPEVKLAAPSPPRSRQPWHCWL